MVVVSALPSQGNGMGANSVRPFHPWGQADRQRPALSRAEQAIAAQKAALDAAMAQQASQVRPSTPPPAAVNQHQQPESRPDADDLDFDDATRAAIAASLRDLQVWMNIIMTAV
jgi:hypothetical protein